MSTMFSYVYNVQSNAMNVTAEMTKLRQSVAGISPEVKKLQSGFQNTMQSVKRSIDVVKMDALLNQVDRVATGLNNATAPGLQFNASMKELEAMTGVAGAKLDEIGNYARKAGTDFGTGAAGGVESYKLLLGQLTPEIAKQPKALAEMGRAVAITSKLMKGDQTAATEVLTTAMNQYGVSLENPIAASKKMSEMMNVMAAAAGAGSAELPAIKAALEQSGMAAKAANVSFEETNAAIQVLDKAGKKGSEGGVALRNVMATLGQGRFLPKQVQEELINAGVNVRKLTNTSIPLTDRLKALNPIMKDNALVSALFGKENSNAALALMQGVPELEKMATAIRGTNTAQEQANKIMESQTEKNARLQAQIDNFKISLFTASNGAVGYAAVLGGVASQIGGLVPLLTAGQTAVKAITASQKVQTAWTAITTAATAGWTAVQMGLNAAFAANPVGATVVAVAALTAGVVYAWKKFDTFRGVIMGVWETIKGFGLTIKNYVLNRFKELISGITGVGQALYQLFTGDFKKAWETGKKAMTDLSGINSAKSFVQDGVKAAKSFTDGYDKGVKLYKKPQEATAKTFGSTQSGIAPPKIPGVGTGNNSYTGKSSGDSPNKTNSAIATGGTKHNYITIRIDELNGIKTGSLTNTNGTIDKTGQSVQEQLLRVLAMATTAGD